MISSVRGSVIQLGGGYAVIEVGGVGMRVEIPSGARAPRLTLHAEASLFTALIVREDALTLFGFETTAEIDVFHHMITVSGVGPRSALGVLSTLTPAEIAQAVRDENDKVFRTVPGIGPKTSKLLVVQLAGKLDAINTSEMSSGAVAGSDSASSVVEGLIGLGWSEAQATKAVSDARTAGADDTAAALMRAALALLQAPGIGGGRS